MHKLSWDETIPTDLHSAWMSFRKQIPSLRQVLIPRHVVSPRHTILELHGFSDAAQNAYGACVYVRSVDHQHKIQVRLLCSKTKVALLKIQTIPRLELCAALILARLIKKVINSLSISFRKVAYWCDSTIVLS